MFQIQQDDFAIQERKDRSPGGPLFVPHPGMNMRYMRNDLPDDIFLVLQHAFGYGTKMGEVSHQLQFRKFNEIRNEGCGMIGKSGPGVFRGEYEHLSGC